MGYIFQGKEYESIFTISKEIGIVPEWEKEIHNVDFLLFVKQEDEKKYERIRKLLLQSIDEDVLLFRVRETLNPFLPFCFHGKTFETMKELGETLLSFSPTPSSIYLSILRNDLISEYMTITLYSKDHKKEYEEIREIEKESRKDLFYAYYSMGYYLSKSQNIIYDHVRYENIYNFTYFLAKKEKDLSAFGSYLSFSPLLMAYSKYAKDGKKVEEYLHLCSQLDNSQMQVENFMLKRKKK